MNVLSPCHTTPLAAWFHRQLGPTGYHPAALLKTTELPFARHDVHRVVEAEPTNSGEGVEPVRGEADPCQGHELAVAPPVGEAVP